MRRKHRKLRDEPELDITAFMNLMIVLVPVLLLSMVFSHTSIIELNFPTGESSAPLLEDESVQLQVTIRKDRLLVSDSKGGMIGQVEAIAGVQDTKGLRELLKKVKARLPEKKDVVLLVESDTEYQTLVSVMDAVRAFPTVVAANLVYAELFPDISIGDASSAPPATTTEGGAG
ncbi:MAG: biopolymer transporter ExbD [Hahellaceae bacterium]|nr:biopolymer transporter ExbD [Hahellaceae bacterium]